MKKILFIILDGLGDRPVFNGETPVEHAKTPNMDRLAKKGVTGIMYVLGKGIRPNSDEAHLTLFGYDAKKYCPGRGAIEAAGVGFKLKQGDIAIRANLASVDKKLRVKDRRTGRIESTKEFVKHLGMKIDGIKIIVKPGTGHRVIIIMRGKGLSDKISNSDVHYVTAHKIVDNWMNKKVNKIKALDKSKEAKFTAKVLQKFLDKSHKMLEKNPLNNERERKEKLKGNYLLTRGPGCYKKLKSFKERYGLRAGCIAGAGLYKGLGAIAGMELIDVKGATGMPNTNVKAKFKKAREKIKDYDFIFVHVKPTDIFGENGDCVGKKNFIEKIDKALKVLMNFNGIIAITGDHATPCSLKDHSGDPVPVLIYGNGSDSTSRFGEKECKKGKLGTIYGKNYMRKILELAGK